MKVPGLSNFAGGGIYDEVGCGVAVFSVCVFVQTAAMKCDLASGFHDYWFQVGRWFGLQCDLDFGS